MTGLDGITGESGLSTVPLDIGTEMMNLQAVPVMHSWSSHAKETVVNVLIYMYV